MIAAARPTSELDPHPRGDGLRRLDRIADQRPVVEIRRQTMRQHRDETDADAEIVAVGAVILEADLRRRGVEVLDEMRGEGLLVVEELVDVVGRYLRHED